MAYTYQWPDMIRAAATADPRGLWALATEADIHYSNMVKFMAGGAGLSLASAERLCAVLGMSIGAMIDRPLKSKVESTPVEAPSRAVVQSPAIPTPTSRPKRDPRWQEKLGR